eukprot:4204875-Pyramimonas_sp.AAC.1
MCNKCKQQTTIGEKYERGVGGHLAYFDRLIFIECSGLRPVPPILGAPDAIVVEMDDNGDSRRPTVDERVNYDADRRRS